jgi:hypothetical protein
MDRRSLEGLQRFVLDSIRRSEAVTSDADVAGRAARILLPSKRGLSAASRLDVYREQYWLRHLANLNDDFPTLAWVVGATGFHDLARGYLETFPPRTWNLQRLGADVPAYVKATAPWHLDPLAVDASILDWAFMEAFDAADAGPLDLGALAGASEDAWMSARIALDPSLRLVSLGYPVHDLREAVRRGEALERPPAATTRLVVWRDGSCLLHATAVEPGALDLLDRLRGGAPLGQACDALSRDVDAEAAAVLGAQVSEWFRQWTARGWVTAVLLGPP